MTAQGLGCVHSLALGSFCTGERCGRAAHRIRDSGRFAQDTSVRVVPARGEIRRDEGEARLGETRSYQVAEPPRRLDRSDARHSFTPEGCKGTFLTF